MKDLSLPIVTWFIIALSMLVLIIVRSFHTKGSIFRHHGHIIELGSEREEFFIPGDRLLKDEDLNDNED